MADRAAHSLGRHRACTFAMIDLGMIAGLHEHDHSLAAYCTRCDRWAVLDLEQMVKDGYGARRLPITVRCMKCGEPGRLQVRPPVPTWQGSTWMLPA